MHLLSAWFVRNRVAANLLVVLVLCAGYFSVRSMRIEGFPALPPSSVTITTLYPGASAEQVDRGITRKIEKSLEGLPGVRKVASYSAENESTVWVRKQSRFAMDRFQQEITTRLEAIPNLPQRSERPIVARDEFSVEALLVQVYGGDSTSSLQKTARQVREELLAHPQIAKLTPFGLRPHEIRIEVDDTKLRGYGLTLAQVAQAIDRASLDYRTGTLKSDAGRVVIRADRKAFHYEEFASIPLRTQADGTRLLVGDVARIIDGFAEEEFFARYQQEPSVGLLVYTSRKGHLMEVSAAAHEVVTRMRPQLPAGIKVDIWGETSIYMRARLSLLATNAWQGLLIVFVLLALFLNLKLAFWVAMGIPISLAGALVLMGDRFLGYSLNDITTFGMIVVLGILVDDAIVVGESVFEMRTRIEDPESGTLEGVRRVSTATVFGCFTTVAAFYPLLLIDNDLGRIFASFCGVVIVSLLVSLLESKFILPAHLAAVSLERSSTPNAFVRLWRGIQATSHTIVTRINQRLYQPLLARALRFRYATLIVFLTLALVGLAACFKGWVRTVFFPDVPGQIIVVTLQMNSGSPRHLTVANVAAIEEAASAINDEAMTELQTSVPPIARLMTALTGPFSAEIYAELRPEKERRLETMETLRRWRRRVGTLEGVEKLSFSGSLQTGGGFIVELASRNEVALRAATAEFCAALVQFEGVHDVRSDLDGGSPQIHLRLKPEAQHLGLRTADLASQIGDAFGGLEVQRVQRGTDEVSVTVQYTAQRRRFLNDLFNTHIQTASGQWVPLSLVASLHAGTVPSTLHRKNGQRVVQVRAALDKSQLSATEAFDTIKQKIAAPLQARYPGLTLRGAGELEEIGELQDGLKRALLLILILIYALLAVPLRSYGQPLVIMSVIPFGFVGAVLGHWVMDYPLSILSFFGMLAAMGVVVNDSLVMITCFNDMRQQGCSLQEALVGAGGTRFRAIFLTTVTTVCGLLPLLSERSEQAQYLIPAAISLAWGELFATPLTLFIVPLLIHIADDLRWVCHRLLSVYTSPSCPPTRAGGQ